MRKYEVIFIMKPAEEDSINATVAKFENLINTHGGNVEKIDRWGKRRLAYEVKDHSEGIYTLIYFTAEPKTVFELERVMKISDDILRHMVVKEDE